MTVMESIQHRYVYTCNARKKEERMDKGMKVLPFTCFKCFLYLRHCQIITVFKQEGYCHFQNISIGVTVESYMNISKGNTTELKQAVAQYGPVSVLISTQPKSFKFYSSGVYYDPECGKSCFVEKYIYKAPLKRK